MRVRAARYKMRLRRCHSGCAFGNVVTFVHQLSTVDEVCIRDATKHGRKAHQSPTWSEPHAEGGGRCLQFALQQSVAVLQLPDQLVCLQQIDIP